MRPPGEQYDAIVVGAGIVGCAIAHRLQRAGAKTLVIDAKPSGGGTTAAGMGHVLVLDGSDAELALTEWSRRLWERLLLDLPPSAECDPCGTLWVAENSDQLEQAAEKLSPWLKLGIECEMVGADQLQSVEPALRPGLAGALRVIGDRVVYPPVVCNELLKQFCADGGHLRSGTSVTSIAGGSVTLADGATIAAPAIISAAGLHAIDLLSGSPMVRPRLFARKGHLAITTRMPRGLQHQVAELGYHESAHGSDETSVAFNVQPRVTGQILIGSSRQNNVTTPEVDPKILHRMLERASEFMPGLRHTPILRTWTGLRPASCDGLPIIGEVPGVAGVYVAAGHEGLGLTTSLGTAEIIYSAVQGTPCEIDASPFHPSRGAESIGVGDE